MPPALMLSHLRSKAGALLLGHRLKDEVFADVLHRQWVFTIPKRLRIYFRFDRALIGKLCRAAYETVLASDGYITQKIGDRCRKNDRSVQCFDLPWPTEICFARILIFFGQKLSVLRIFSTSPASRNTKRESFSQFLSGVRQIKQPFDYRSPAMAILSENSSVTTGKR